MTTGTVFTMHLDYNISLCNGSAKCYVLRYNEIQLCNCFKPVLNNCNWLPVELKITVKIDRLVCKTAQTTSRIVWIVESQLSKHFIILSQCVEN